MLSSHVYPKATFVRDSFYGPLALNDVNLSADCYRWFAETQNPATGQIRTAVPFDPKNDYPLQIGDDDSSLLFVIWSAWLKRNRVNDRSRGGRTGLVVRQDARVDDYHLTPAQPFCYWADTVQFERRSAWRNNQGLYVLAARSCWSTAGATSSPPMYDQANAQYAEFYRPDLGA